MRMGRPGLRKQHAGEARRRAFSLGGPYSPRTAEKQLFNLPQRAQQRSPHQRGVPPGRQRRANDLTVLWQRTGPRQTQRAEALRGRLARVGFNARQCFGSSEGKRVGHGQPPQTQRAGSCASQRVGATRTSHIFSVHHYSFFYFRNYVNFNISPSISSCRSVVYLEIDNRQCYQQSTECFQSATDVAAFLGALATSGNLNVPYIEAVTST